MTTINTRFDIIGPKQNFLVEKENFSLDYEWEKQHKKKKKRKSFLYLKILKKLNKKKAMPNIKLLDTCSKYADSLKFKTKNLEILDDCKKEKIIISRFCHGGYNIHGEIVWHYQSKIQLHYNKT